MRTFLLLASLALASCGGSSGGSSKTNADALVTGTIADDTTETSEPIDVNGRNFVFPTGEDAFDDVLPPDTGPVVD
jgi:hypothetical protein